MPAKERKFYWSWLWGSLFILIPKQRGDGWLKCPLGHHWDADIAEMSEVIGSDCEAGMDGYLEFYLSTKITTYPDKQKIVEDKLFPLISKKYKCVKGDCLSFVALDDLRQGKL